MALGILATDFALAQGVHRTPALTVDLPLTESSICGVAPSWGAAAKIPVGVECTWGPGTPAEARRQRIVDTLDLSDLELPESIRMLADQLPTFRITFDGRIATFRPRAEGASTPPSILDRRVPVFELRDASPIDAAVAVNRIFVPDYVLSGSASAIPILKGQSHATSERNRLAAEAAIDKFNGRFDKSISVALENATVESILNAIAGKSGLSWRVIYVRPSRQYADCIIELLTGGAPIRTGGAIQRARR